MFLNEYSDLMQTYVKDAFDPGANFALGYLYETQGHNAAAASFYLRAAEYGSERNLLLAYEALLRLSLVIDKQSQRFTSARNALLKSIALFPKRPEGYFLLSRLYEKAKEYEQSYFIACVGLASCDRCDFGPLRTDVEYPGVYGLDFEKAVSGWWIGYKDQSVELFKDLDKVDLDNLHRAAVDNNMLSLGIIPLEQSSES